MLRAKIGALNDGILAYFSKEKSSQNENRGDCRNP